jgi:hypothetical protein
MSLFEYYKKSIYEHGYDYAERDSKYGTNHRNVDDDIYFNDEMDYNICADYYGSYVGGLEDWTDEDIDFLKVLGFVPTDFEEYEG